MFVLLTISEIILQSSVIFLPDKHNYLHLVYLIFFDTAYFGCPCQPSTGRVLAYCFGNQRLT